MTDRADSRTGERVVSRRRPWWSRVARKLPLLLWLTLVWGLLWGTYDAGTVFFGVLVSVLVMSVFPVPSISTDLALRPLRVVELVAYLAWDMASSTLRVSWQALRHGPRIRAGIVEVTLRIDSDHLIALLANGLSLAPGKFVLQIDRPNRICYVYTLGMITDPATIRSEVLALERRVVRAFGSAGERERMTELSDTGKDTR
ncbi:multicomponent Na+:H+ antiporter subunit E [Saccharopolyspora lacisalsi]|uniref:Multicomponent Na+:H+ antiporter subunit E n=1 Tax=Halosaccharopolyspora lacisalsi TaxID=1000566 RepID=A0A839E7L6_9PSEU|nr:Na+/H+ antiporter subunit E [Halosaccharopolyspora lacisalsi]MBA8826868.1 multicomponent Na+:H+ antiporter subunit E [Halosaccharopolyspora lacisalsi]